MTCLYNSIKYIDIKVVVLKQEIAHLRVVCNDDLHIGTHPNLKCYIPKRKSSLAHVWVALYLELKIHSLPFSIHSLNDELHPLSSMCSS